MIKSVSNGKGSRTLLDQGSINVREENITADNKNKKEVTEEDYGRFTDPMAYQEITMGDERYNSYRQASHVMLYAPTELMSIQLYQRRAIVLMQMRFDGYIGFPGGLVDEGEEPTEAVNRELEEEIGWNRARFGSIKKEDHVFSHVDEVKKLVLHFYAKEISEKIVNEVEQESMVAKEHGHESLGLIFVPLYTMSDGFRGLPSFLRNNFIGNAKKQLLLGLLKVNILTQEQIDKAMTAQPSPF